LSNITLCEIYYLSGVKDGNMLCSELVSAGLATYIWVHRVTTVYIIREYQNTLCTLYSSIQYDIKEGNITFSLRDSLLKILYSFIK